MPLVIGGAPNGFDCGADGAPKTFVEGFPNGFEDVLSP